MAAPRMDESPPQPGSASGRHRCLRNDEKELRGMSEWFRRFAREIGVAEPKALDFELCLNELVTNIIHYGYDAPGGHEIHITLERDRGELRATIEDDGRPFDPLGAEPPVPPATLEDATMGGWGIPIARALVDEWRYERREGWNRLTIVSRDSQTERSNL